MQKLSGRYNEIELLESIFNSGKSEFVALYGRRRIGKTFLIRSVFKKRFSFQVTGVANATLNQQLVNFHNQLLKCEPATESPIPKNWMEAFNLLSIYLEKSKVKRKVIFIDELPWFDTPNSKFIQALEYFWNSWASARDDVLLIACGSATSWIINKLINSKGGLHNRVTRRMRLEPFTLKECEAFLKSKNVALDKYQIVQLYMAFGGVPFYWEDVQRGESAMQAIDRACFSENGFLKNEFYNLFRSLFYKPEKYLKIIQAIATKSSGLTRDEIIKQSGLPNAGSTTRVLAELEESGFIKRYTPFGKLIRNSVYQLVDFYSHFYLKFIGSSNMKLGTDWVSKIDTPAYRAWSGYAFELVCLNHLQQLKMALGISGVYTEASSWRATNRISGAQVDLVIDRRDQVINLCESKFSINSFTISKKYAAELRNKIGVFKAESNTRKSVFLTMITTFGVNQNEHSIGLVQNEIMLEDLFK